jgi:hypothetical protein
MDKEKVIGAVVGGIIAGFSIGVGFLIAQRTMGKWVSKKAVKEQDDIADAVKKGVSEGVKEANFSAMSAQNNATRSRRGGGSSFMGFDGKMDSPDWSVDNISGSPLDMTMTSDPMSMASPNSSLNVW